MQSNVAFFVTVFCVSTSTQTTHRVYFTAMAWHIFHIHFVLPAGVFLWVCWVFLEFEGFYANALFAKCSAFSFKWFICAFACKFLGVVVLKVGTSWGNVWVGLCCTVHIPQQLKVFKTPEYLLAQCKPAPVTRPAFAAHTRRWQSTAGALRAPTAGCSQRLCYPVSSTVICPPVAIENVPLTRRSGLHFLGLFGREIG